MKKRILSIVLVALLLSTSCAFAGTTQISVKQNEACIRINEEILNADNFNYNGTLYIPLRAVSESMGEEVNWNQDYETAVVVTTNANKAILAKGCIDVLSYSYLAQNVLNNYSNMSPNDISSIRVLMQNEYYTFVNSSKGTCNWDTRFKDSYDKTEGYYKKLVGVMVVLENAKTQSIKSINPSAKTECEKIFKEVFSNIKTISDSVYSIN
ncbi:MAG: stalk domain-containing protein [Aminipila sp.]